MLKTQTLRPGYLVSLKTSIRGNVSYRTTTLEEERTLDDGSARARWETLRRVQDATEQEEAVKIRSKARSLITSVCADSSFGLLCPEHKADDLASAVSEARELAETFNATASFSNISVYVIAGRVARDDVEAARAINSEVSELIESMERGIKSLDAEAIRAAANKIRAVGSMLSDEAAEQTQKAIAAARSVARRIVKAGEAAALEVDQATLRTLAAARTMFLDLEDAAEMGEVSAPAARVIDLEPAPDGSVTMPFATGITAVVAPDGQIISETPARSAMPAMPLFEME